MSGAEKLTRALRRAGLAGQVMIDREWPVARAEPLVHVRLVGLDRPSGRSYFSVRAASEEQAVAALFEELRGDGIDIGPTSLPPVPSASADRR